MQSEIPVVSFICAALVLVPLPCHLRARNIATVSIIAWLFVVNVIYAIDAIVWSGNSRIIAPVWCDITSTLITGVHIALPAACLCICIHLERIASFSQVSTPVAKRRRIIFESLMCFGLPLVYIALHFIVQSHRFDVFEGFGCRPTTFTSIPAIFLVWIPPLFLSLATLFHAGLSWRQFLCRGIQFARCGYGSPLSLTSSHYNRLVVISVLEVVWVIVVISVEMRFKLSSGLEPWTSLSDVHKDFSRVLAFDVQDTSRSTTSFLLFSWLAVPIESLLFFALFASGDDAVAAYKRSGNWIKRFLFSRQKSDSSSMECHKTPMCSAITFNDPFAAPPVTILDSSTINSHTSATNSVSQLSIAKLQSSPASSRPSSPSPSHKQDDDDTSFISATLSYLDSPTGRSAVASSHNSLESNFDPNLIIIAPVNWPEPPSTIPVRPPHRSTSIGYLQSPNRHRSQTPFDDSTVQLSNPPKRNRPTNGVKRSQSRNAVYMTVVKETSEV